jgi:hypothetical protein
MFSRDAEYSDFYVAFQASCREFTQGNLHASYLEFLILKEPVAVAEQSETWTAFDRSDAVIAGSNPAVGMVI